jgi:8-oxo-dGTP pyrophosphatase MutT (NUDIX family)
MGIGRFLGGIGVLVWDPDNNKYLLLKRSEQKDFAAGLWEFVTGRLDQGEGFEEAAHREVFEELEVDVKLLQILGTTHFYRGEQRPENELIGVIYLGSINSAVDIKISHEHSEYRWLLAREVIELLSSSEGSEGWLARVIDRAEKLRENLPEDLSERIERTGFELDPKSPPDSGPGVI